MKTGMMPLAALVALGIWAAPAAADGPYPVGPPRERYVPCCIGQDYNWSGVFVGGHIAVGRSNADGTVTGPVDGFDHGDTAFGGGIQAAVQRQWGRMVAGVEVSYTWIDFEDSTASLASPGTTTLSSNVSDLLIVAGKLGYAQDQWLAYAKAGFASADFSVSSTVTGTTTTSSGRENGWMLGVGLDYALSNRFILGVEYDWSFFSVDRSLGARSVDVSSDIQMLSARLTYKFGAD